MNIRYERVTINDIDEQLRLQKEAFLPLLEKYKDGDFNPANTNREKMLKRVSLDDGIYFKIIFDNEVVGGLFAYSTDSSHKEMCLSTLYIAPRAQGKDLAQKAIKYLEDICVDVERWYLEVPELELKNRYIYEKFGYKRTEETIVINERLTLLIYRK